MKPTPNSQRDLAPLLAFGAHPDDIEFGCGGVIANETRYGRAAHFVVCSRGEAATNGSPEQRVKESKKAARILGATLDFVELDGDARLELAFRHLVTIARVIRSQKPGIVLAPSPVENQHPDHWRLGQLVRDASRLARYGGAGDLREYAPHAIDQLFFYAVTPEAEPRDRLPILVDVSEPKTFNAWTKAMKAHASQMKALDYSGLQISRAKWNGKKAGVEYAIPIYANDPLLVDSLASLGRGARRF